MYRKSKFRKTPPAVRRLPVQAKAPAAPLSARTPSAAPAKRILYKYMLREHARGMVERGEFRIGTLYDFRKQEKYGTEIGDSGEGKKTVSTVVNLAEMASDESDTLGRQKPFVSQFIDLQRGNVILRDCHFEMRYESPDYYMYCFSDTADATIMERMGKECCLEIRDAKSFLLALTECLVAKDIAGGQCLFKRCTYGSRSMKYNGTEGEKSAFLKPVEQSYMHEVRAIWEPRGSPKPFVDIVCPAASAFLRDYPL